MDLRSLVEKEVCECSRVGHTPVPPVRHLRVSEFLDEYAFSLGWGLTGLLKASVWFQTHRWPHYPVEHLVEALGFRGYDRAVSSQMCELQAVPTRRDNPRSLISKP